MILAWIARKLQQSHFQNAQEKGRRNTPPQPKVTLTEKGTIDATVHPPPPPPPPPPPLLPRLPLNHPVLQVATTHTKERTSAATTGPRDTPQGTTTQDPLHAALLYLGACKIVSDEVNLWYLISYYTLKMYHPPLNLARGWLSFMAQGMELIHMC